MPFPHEAELSHSDHSPQSDQVAAQSGIIRTIHIQRVHLLWSYFGKQVDSGAPLCTVLSQKALPRKQQQLEH